jgi:septal ring factor EnvC (AmiA/AmiB activator)
MKKRSVKYSTLFKARCNAQRKVQRKAQLKAYCTAAVLCFLLFSLSSQDAYSLDFSSIDTDLQALENLINDTLANTEEQQKLLEDLKKNLDESGNLIANYGNIIQEQESLLSVLREQLNEMSETYRMQSQLSAKYAQSLKFWRTFSLIAIPVTAVISGTIVWAAAK